MRVYVFAFLAMVQLLAAQDKSTVIENFGKAVKQGAVVKYKMHFTWKDDSRVVSDTKSECAEKYVPSDTSARGYYNLRSDDDRVIYTGMDYYDYSPDYYGEGIVKVSNKKKQTMDFTVQEIEMGGIKGYYYGVLYHHPLYHVLLLHFMRYFENDSVVAACTLLKDTTINGADCYRLKISKWETLSLNKSGFLPVHYIRSVQGEDSEGIPFNQVMEASYSDYSLNNADSAVLFSRKSFPKNFKFKSDPKPLTKKVLAVGSAVPEWELKTIKDRTVSLKSLKGKPLLLIFSEIGCLPCMAAIPCLNEIATGYKDINVYAVYPKDSKEALQKLSEKKNYKYDILYNASDVAKSYFVGGYPTFFFIDRDGILRKTLSGYGDGMKKDIIGIIDDLLK